MTLPDSNIFEQEQTHPSFLHIDGIDPKEKAAWVKAANTTKHRKLSRWVVDTLNEAANNQRKKDGGD